MHLSNLLPFQMVFENSFTTDNSCPLDLPYSCTNSTPIENSCCFENPGGIMLQTQFWDYYPPIGGNETFTLHGLWPDNCDGSYEQFCDRNLEIHGVEPILDKFEPGLYDEMKTYWKNFNGNDELLWEHEFNKHGTCVKTIRPQCYGNFQNDRNVYDYFKVATNLYKSLPTFEFLKEEGIVPSNEKTYTKKQIDDALTKHFGQKVFFKCNKYQGLQEIWYFHHLKGSLLQENFKPIDTLSHSSCPETGIKFFPKGALGPSPPPSPGRRGYLKISNGCLISNGKFFTKGTCATFRLVNAEFGGYNILSSKGTCGIVDDKIVCNRSKITKNQFNFKDGLVGFNSKFKWCIEGSKDQKDVVLSDGTCEEFEIRLQ